MADHDLHDAATDGEAATPEPETRREYRGAGIMWGAIALVVLAAVFVIVALQNAHNVEFDFLWWTATTPLILIIAITMAATLVVEATVGLLWRRRRRVRLQEKEELRHLRGER